MEKQRYEIRLQLDEYNDLFSDFDPRPYSERALSDDFLEEIKKASLGKGEEMDMHFFFPKEKRNTKDEGIIKKRLLIHFKRHYQILQEESRKHKKAGICFTALGIVLMFGATFFLFKWDTNIFTSFAIILLEPASWFLFWEGLNLIIFTSKKKQPELVFYEKMSRARIFFSSRTELRE